MKEKAMRRIERDTQIFHDAIKISTRQYISFSEMKFITRNILKTLQDRYKQSNVKIVEMLHDQYYALKISLVKAKIEH